MHAATAGFMQHQAQPSRLRQSLPSILGDLQQQCESTPQRCTIWENLHVKACCAWAQAQNGSTALHNAAANGHAKAVEALVDAPSCDCDVQNSNGNTALHLAASKGVLCFA